MKAIKIISIAAGGLLILLIVAVIVIQEAQESKSRLPELYEVPSFNFTESHGRAFTKDDLLGKITVVDFIFTNCKGPCPMMSSRMAELYDLYAGTETIQFVSVSVDPERDSLQALRDYAESYGVNDRRWVFLRSGKPEVVRLYENGFKLGGALPYDHSIKFVLVDQDAVIRGYYDSSDANGLKHLKDHINVLYEQLK